MFDHLAMRHVALLCCMALASADPATLVHVPALGSLEGETSSFSRDVAVYNGIPYAKPPVAHLRWRPPESYGRWKGILNASNFGRSCFTFEEKDPEESEDCLFLNIAAPIRALSGHAKLPVMVYIHGGAYTSGDTRQSHIDSLVARSNLSILVVSMNYRLNVFGFLGSVVLKNRSPIGSFGNYGIEDQRLALSWVHRHISAFGGDGSDVTIFGESAGGNSVIQHLSQPRSFGLYSKAIIESGAYIGSKTLSDAEHLFQMILKATTCVDLDCLLLLSGPTLVVAVRKLALKDGAVIGFGPVLDGASLAASPQQLIDRGEYNNKVPVIIGSNRDEASYFMERDSMLPHNATQAQLDDVLRVQLPQLSANEIEEAKQLYAPSKYTYPVDLGKYSMPWWIGMRMATDGISGLGACTVRRLARMMVQGRSPAVFAYVFDHPSQENLTDMNEGVHAPGTGFGSPLVPHTSELPYVFSWLEALREDVGEASLALQMSKYWQQFARDGDPNEPNLPAWPRYSPDADKIMGFDVGRGGIQTKQHLRNAACDFWEAHMGWPRSGDSLAVYI